MEEQKQDNKLFPPTEQPDDRISLEEDEADLPRKERNFGKGNFFLLAIVLLLAAMVVVFLFLGMQRRNAVAGDMSSQDTDASQAMLQSNPEGTTSTEDSTGGVSLPTENSQSEDLSSESNPPEDADFHGWIINSMGYTYLYHGVGVEQFNYSDATLGRYLSSIQSLACMVPDGTSIYCMPVPTRIGFLYEEISDTVKREDDFFNSWQQTFLDTVEDRLRPAISVVNLYAPFAEAYQADSELFFRTDKNWTSDAAYLAYQSFCSASGNPPVALSAYEEKRMEGFLGSFYTATNAEILLKNADVFRYYQNKNTNACTVTLYSNGYVYRNYSLAGNAVMGTSAAYSVYLGTTGQHFKIESPCPSGKNLLIVGDGSAAAMLPFLIENYTEIHYIDVASYTDSFPALFASNTFHDVLFMSYVTNAVKGEYPAHLAVMAGIVQEDE